MILRFLKVYMKQKWNPDDFAHSAVEMTRFGSFHVTIVDTTKWAHHARHLTMTCFQVNPIVELLSLKLFDL
jgi:hypothetical protein